MIILPLELDGVWKSYPRWSAGARTVRALLNRRVPALARGADRRWAVRDVSLAVGPGESVGVIGRNGAGKSTLLRVASGLTRPTRGRAATSGGTAAVLSLGAWFDLDLTGRENAVTALLVNGWRLRDAKALAAPVLDFAELEEFADAPVRTYSEGMKLRLAFGVVAQLRPRLLVVDEVIAVGDLAFQSKCLGRISELRREGTALLLASHGLEQVAAECDRAIWLDGGAVRASGQAEDVVATYREAMHQATLERTPAPGGPGGGALELGRNRLGSQEVVAESVVLRGAHGEPVSEIQSGEALAVAVRLANNGPPLPAAVVDVAIHRKADGTVCYDTSTQADGVALGELVECAVVELRFRRLDLLPGEYELDVGVYPPDWEYAYDFHERAYPLRIVGPHADSGIYRPPHDWVVRHLER